MRARGFARTGLKANELRKDENVALECLLAHQIRQEDGNVRWQGSVGELIREATQHGDGPIGLDRANKWLRQQGIVIRGDRILISNTHMRIRAMLEAGKATVTANWNLLLRRLPGATPGDGLVKYDTGPARYTSVPLAVILGDAEPGEDDNAGS